MIRLDYVSCGLTIVSTVLVGRKLWAGWVVAALNSVLMCIIGIRTAQFGFVPANVFCIVLYAWNFSRWRAMPSRAAGLGSGAARVDFRDELAQAIHQRSDGKLKGFEAGANLLGAAGGDALQSQRRLARLQPAQNRSGPFEFVGSAFYRQRRARSHGGGHFLQFRRTLVEEDRAELRQQFAVAPGMFEGTFDIKNRILTQWQPCWPFRVQFPTSSSD